MFVFVWNAICNKIFLLQLQESFDSLSMICYTLHISGDYNYTKTLPSNLHFIKFHLCGNLLFSNWNCLNSNLFMKNL